MRMKLFIASDHGGFVRKKELIAFLQKKKISVSDLGPDTSDSCDYPDYAHNVAEKVLQNKGSFGILVCTTGQGMAMAANRHAGIRAALCLTTEMAELSRGHNNANVLCLGAKTVPLEESQKIIEKFLETHFTSEERHVRRIQKIEL